MKKTRSKKKPKKLSKEETERRINEIFKKIDEKKFQRDLKKLRKKTACHSRAIEQSENITARDLAIIVR